MRGLLIAFGWVATVAAAFVLGQTMGEGASGPASETSVVRGADPVVPLDAGPTLAPGAAVPSGIAAADGSPSPATTGGNRVDSSAGETLEPFTLEGVTDPDVAMARIMRHVAAMLANGKDGHLELLKFLDEHIVQSKSLEAMFDDEAQAVRYVVPMIEFLVHRKGEVVGVIESVFKTMAERPELYAEIDDDTLEIFTEGGAFVLPGAVGEERMATFRGYARKLLDTPEGSLPKPVEKQRRRIQQALTLWAPRLSPEDALARLRSGELASGEALPLLRRLTPEQLAALDLGEVLESSVAQMDYRTLRALREIPLQPRDVDLLDGAVLGAAAAGKARDWAVGQYLESTKRGTWPAQQGFLEAGFRRGGAALETCALALARFGGRVPADYFLLVLDTYELSKSTAERLRRQANR